MFPLEDLPQGLLARVASRLPWEDRGALALACKAFCHCALDTDRAEWWSGSTNSVGASCVSLCLDKQGMGSLVAWMARVPPAHGLTREELACRAAASPLAWDSLWLEVQPGPPFNTAGDCDNPSGLFPNAASTPNIFCSTVYTNTDGMEFWEAEDTEDLPTVLAGLPDLRTLGLFVNTKPPVHVFPPRLTTLFLVWKSGDGLPMDLVGLRDLRRVAVLAPGSTTAPLRLPDSVRELSLMAHYDLDRVDLPTGLTALALGESCPDRGRPHRDITERLAALTRLAHLDLYCNGFDVRLQELPASLRHLAYHAGKGEWGFPLKGTFVLDDSPPDYDGRLVVAVPRLPRLTSLRLQCGDIVHPEQPATVAGLARLRFLTLRSVSRRTGHRPLSLDVIGLPNLESFVHYDADVASEETLEAMAAAGVDVQEWD